MMTHSHLLLRCYKYWNSSRLLQEWRLFCCVFGLVSLTLNLQRWPTCCCIQVSWIKSGHKHTIKALVVISIYCIYKSKSKRLTFVRVVLAGYMRTNLSWQQLHWSSSSTDYTVLRCLQFKLFKKCINQSQNSLFMSEIVFPLIFRVLTHSACLLSHCTDSHTSTLISINTDGDFICTVGQ